MSNIRKSGPDQTSFIDARNLLLARLESAWKRLIAVHADMTHVNSESKEYREAGEEMTAAVRAMWRLKAAWSDMT